jgi:hydrophobe/amphiphile efflux-3 (HAE3) family protein
MNHLAEKIITYRWPIIIAFILITILLASQIPHAQLNSDMLTYLPRKMDSRLNKDRIEELFGGTEMIMVLLKTDDVLKTETLKRIKKMSRQMKRITGIDKVMSLFELKHITSEDGAILVNPAVNRIPTNETDRMILREEIRKNDMVYGNVISKDFKITAVIGLVEEGISDAYLLTEIEKLIRNNPGNEEIFIGGTPYSRYNTGLNTQKDLGRLLPLGLLIMLLFLYICFKQLRGVFLPFLVVLMSIFFSMGLIPILGWQITVITIILPVLLIAVANDYGIHLIAKYQEENAPGNTQTKTELCIRVVRSLGLPILLTGLTTMAGMLCLQGHIMIPAGQLGILAAAGILFALAASLLFMPAVVSLLPKAKPIHLVEIRGTKKPLVERILGLFGSLITKHPKLILVNVLLLTAFTSIGIFSVSVNTDPVNYYQNDHPVAVSATLINKNLGGFFPISVVLKGDIKAPSLLKKIDQLEKEIKKYPEVGHTMSIARVVRQMSRVLNEKDEAGYDEIPNNRNATAQYFELYYMSGDPEDFEKLVDFTYEHAIITARINTSSTPVLRRVVVRIKERVKDEPDVYMVGGIADVFSDLSAKVVSGQFISLGLALLVVVLLLMALFRSFSAGIIAAVPLLFSMVILFGLMGLVGIELNVATALLSSIMIGVGIDYTIHFLWRYKAERKKGLHDEEAARETLRTTGRGIIFNAFSVIIGFMALLLSTFVPVRFFGFLVVVSIFTCLVGALIVIPAMVILLKPTFLEPKTIKVQKPAIENEVIYV